MLHEGLLNLSWLGVAAAAFGLTHVTIASVTIFLHRHQSHRALDLHPAVSHFFRFWLWLTTGMITREWVAIHRKHHAKVDGPEDPHSPQIYGIRKVFWEGTELYRKEALCQETLERYGRGTPADWIERNLYSRFGWLGIVLMLLIDLALFGVLGLTVWAVQMAWIPVTAAGVINGIGHWSGYRNHDCEDASRNIAPWGFLIGGEELHNNHHAYATSARLAHRPWEFDLGWLYIRALAALRLATVRHVEPRAVVIAGKERLDLATASALLRTRFRVMHDYTRRVIRPVFREELKRQVGAARKMVRQARQWLTTSSARLNDQPPAELEQALSLSERLRVVHEFRVKLAGIWQREAGEGESLLKALQEWCANAERSGIEALERFSRSLKGYSLQAV